MAPKADSQLIELSGKAYLKVPGRIEKFRETHPNGVITTELISTEPRIIVRATIHGNDGTLIASGYGTAPMQGTSSWKGREIEKAETAAVGRALGFAGYGTLAAFDDDDRDNLADAPIDPPRKAAPPVNGWTQQQYDDLLSEADKAGVDRRAVPGLLGVNRVSEFTPGFGPAADMVRAHGAALKVNGGAK
jgi:hypothetical protein